MAAALIVAVTAACSGPLKRVHMLNEDSHAHEVRPGEAAKFFVPASPEPHRLDVKCTLTGGQAARVRMAYSGVQPIGWAKKNSVFSPAGEEIDVEIEGTVMSTTDEAGWFAFINEDPTELLWHQCYNN